MVPTVGVGGNESAGTELARIKGIVLVNQGQQYTTASEGLQLSSGDRLMTMDGGEATLVFKKDGCEYKLESNRILKIAAQSPCSTEQLAVVRGPTYAALGDPPPGNAIPWWKNPLIIPPIVGGVAAATIPCWNNCGGGGGAAPPASP